MVKIDKVIMGELDQILGFILKSHVLIAAFALFGQDHCFQIGLIAAAITNS